VANSSKVEYDIIANDKASKVMDKIAHAGDSLGKGLGKIGGMASGGLNKLKGGLGVLGKTPALLAGTAVGAAFVGALTSAMDIQEANQLLAAQLGLNSVESKKMGKISGDLYKNAFGDSVAEVNDVMKTVFQSGLATVKDSEDAIKGVTTQVINYSKISGEEALPATRAVAQMLKTGLAKNATEAFDILTRGQQLGINKSEDLLDTFNEYGTQFRKLGLDGPAALGLMNQALQAGARDSDTAADALKEFAIRAVDGSKTTVDGFKSLKLNAKDMQEQMSKGGPEAAKGLDTVLDKLRAVKDPAERSRIAVELFGTKAEDLGAALYAMDASTAVATLGKLKGAAEDAGNTLNDTTKSKITSAWRGIQMAVVDAIGKHMLPQIDKFADWFNGPGRYVLVSWALEGASALIGFADTTLGALQSMMGGLAKYAKVALIAAAGSVAVFNPGMALNMLGQADAVGKWADEAKDGMGKARTELQGWKGQLEKTNLKVKFQADIAELDMKIAHAQKALKDPNLTKTRKAELTAEIASLIAKKNKALGLIGDPKLVATKIAKFEANKDDLDRKIAQAKTALSAKGLTATKKATLKAEIGQLLAAKKKAQDAIDALRGKTVKIVMQYTSTGVNLTAPSSVGRRAGGGPVTKGMPYIVGENRPELFVPNVDGEIIPQVPPKGTGSPYAMGGGGGSVPLVIGSDGSQLGDLLVGLLAKTLKARGGDVKVLKAAGF
jgi:hypothetical protein